MKWYDICNRISLLLHALVSAAGYFLIEAISRHSFTEAWDFMTGRPLVFAYNAALIFTSSLIVYLFRRRCFIRVLLVMFWLLLGIIKRCDPGYPCYTVYRTGSSSSDRWNGSSGKISSQMGSDCRR